MGIFGSSRSGLGKNSIASAGENPIFAERNRISEMISKLAYAKFAIEAFDASIPESSTEEFIRNRVRRISSDRKIPESEILEEFCRVYAEGPKVVTETKATVTEEDDCYLGNTYIPPTTPLSSSVPVIGSGPSADELERRLFSTPWENATQN